MELTTFDIIKNIVVTMKSRKLLKTGNKVCLKVHSEANKPMIASAVKQVWEGVEILKINVVNVPRKPKRFLRKKVFSSGFKKAIVTLKDEKSLALVSGA